MKFTISVVIPLYNAEKYIERTLISVLMQSRLPDEIVIINDGSTDKGVEIANTVLNQNCFKNYKLISTVNCGHSSAANRGVKEASGDYVALIDSDDTWTTDKLLKVSQCLESNINPGQVIFSKFTLIDEFDNLYYQQNTNQCFQAENFWQRLIIEGNIVYGSNSSVVLKRETFLNVKGYDINLRACEDWDLWIRLAKSCRFTFIPEYLVNIRFHDDNQSGDKKLMMDYLLKVVAKHQVDIKIARINFFEIIEMILMQQGKKVFYFYFSSEYKHQRLKMLEITGLHFIRFRTFIPTIAKMSKNSLGRVFNRLLRRFI